jgi:hypothetical protein
MLVHLELPLISHASVLQQLVLTPGGVWPTTTCASPERVILQEPLLYLYVSVYVFCASPA